MYLSHYEQAKAACTGTHLQLKHAVLFKAMIPTRSSDVTDVLGAGDPPSLALNGARRGRALAPVYQDFDCTRIPSADDKKLENTHAISSRRLFLIVYATQTRI